MEFSFSAQRWLLPEEIDPLLKPRDFALGFHMPGRFDRVLDIDRCWLQSELANEILNIVKNFALASRKTAWDSHLHTGFWRFLVIREAKNTGQTMVNIVTYDHDPELLRGLTESLLQAFPQLAGIVNNTTRSLSGSAFGEAEFLLAGAATIEEKLDGKFFAISANSFFQTNTSQAERLYQKALDFACLAPTDVVFDLYSGTGTIAIFLSPFVARVVGVEVIESAVTNARRNAIRNQIDNCEFVLGDVRDEFRNAEQLTATYGKPNVIILDPPRAGIHPKSLQGILALKPERIVYISCNPATFARDARLLCASSYRLQQVQPVDMFPHTYHVELVAELQRQVV